MGQAALDTNRVGRLVHTAGMVVVALSMGGLWPVSPPVRAQEPSQDVSVEVTGGPQEGAILPDDVDVVVEEQASTVLEQLTAVLAPVNDNSDESTSTTQVQRKKGPEWEAGEGVPGEAFLTATEPPGPPAATGSTSDEPDSGEPAESDDQLAANLPADRPDSIAPQPSPATSRSFGDWWLWLILAGGVGAAGVVVARGLRGR